MKKITTKTLVGWIVGVSLGWSISAKAEISQSRENALPSPVEQYRAVLNRYCVSCHNQRTKAGGLMLDKVNLADVAADAIVWEKVVRKLRTLAMPPVGVARPDVKTSDDLASWLEGELDRAAAANPLPGSVSAVHRLSRTEYKNAIRDLLGLSSLPQEFDVDFLLPADNATSGFDNAAIVLAVSPTLLERYVVAAEKIARLAVGDPAMPPIVETYRFPGDFRQDVHEDGLPYGTRGGAVIQRTFPLSGEYLLKMELAGVANESDQIEVSVDGSVVRILSIDRDTKRSDLQLRLQLAAGPHSVGATFLQYGSILDEETVRPYLPGRGRHAAFSKIVVTGPNGHPATDNTPSRQRIFICRPGKVTDELPCARKILSTLARRAYRRQAAESDLQYLLSFYKTGRENGRGFDRGIQAAIVRLLVSPSFLFRLEHDADAGAQQPHRISDIDLASRLSFFLWSSIPDDELLDLAIAGRLSNPAVLHGQVQRMLTDQRAETLVSNFAAQWLGLRDLDSKEPSQDSFPDFDENLRQAFRQETQLFLENILLEDRSILDLLRAKYTFVNERLAKHYGIPGVYGNHFRRVTFAGDDPRGGLLGLGSILTLTSYSTRTTPVVRGKWVLETLLGAAPPPPPPNVPALKPTNSDGAALSMRQAMIAHRANPACSSCHARMDPIGFALENFDGVGRWRTVDAGSAIDPSGILPDGRQFSGVTGLRQLLLDRPEVFVTNVTERLLEYAIGRRLEYYDGPAVRTIVRQSRSSDYKISSLIAGVVDSLPFRMRQATAPVAVSARRN